MNKDLRVLFMGTPDFAVVSCKALMAHFQLLCVVTQPDRPKGRGSKQTAPAVKQYALEHGIPVFQPETLKKDALLPLLQELQPDIIVVAAYGRILPDYILKFPRYGCVNVHGSLLPKYRGAAPIQRAVINGERKTGVTIMRMDRGMDTGDMILQTPMEILDTDTAGTLFERMAQVGADTLLHAIEQILSGTASYISQNEKEATYAPMIEKAEAEIDFQADAGSVRARIMGMNPSPGAFYYVGQQRLKLLEAFSGHTASALPGTVTAVSEAGIEVACGDGRAVLLTVVQKEGKNKMSAYSYACGAKLAVGERLK